MPRPADTVVVKMDHRYAVCPKISKEERPNKNTKYGPVIGYIENNTFVPRISEKPNPEEPFTVYFGAVILLLPVALVILKTLLGCFPLETAKQILVLACLKILAPSISERDVSSEYRKSYLSVVFPGVAVNKNSIAKLYHDVGLNITARQKFTQERLSTIESSHILYIDGAHRQLNSKNNTLSKTPYMAKYKGYDVINIITLYNSETGDIPCVGVYPGSFSDTSIYKKYITTNNITKDIFNWRQSFFISNNKKYKRERF